MRKIKFIKDTPDSVHKEGDLSNAWLKAFSKKLGDPPRISPEVRGRSLIL